MSKSHPNEADTAADPGRPTFSGQRSVSTAPAFSSAQMKMAGLSGLDSLPGLCNRNGERTVELEGGLKVEKNPRSSKGAHHWLKCKE